MKDQRLGHQVAHGHPRVERAVGVLKDDLQVPAKFPERASVRCAYVAAVKHDASGRGRYEPKHAASDGRLAASRLTDEAESLTLADAERNAVDCFYDSDGASQDGAASDREVLDEILDV